MSLFYDRLRVSLRELAYEAPKRYPDLPRKDSVVEFYKLVSSCVVVDATNVAKYFYEVIDQEYFSAKDFPNIAPPFESLWFDYTHPAFIRSEILDKPLIWIDPDKPRPHAWGIWIQSDSVEAGLKRCEPMEFTEPPKWWLRIHLFVQSDRNATPYPIPQITWELPVGSDGQFQCDPKGQPVMACNLNAIIRSNPNMTESEINEARDGCQSFLNCALMSLCFMHCKNVPQENVEPKLHYTKVHAKKHGIPLVSYKILKIDAIRRTLASHGAEGQSGIKQALHICRGHFKTYTKDAPLLGKHTGTFWWEMQTRGDIQQGMIDKRYKELVK